MRRHHREGESVLVPREHPFLLLCADEDSHQQLLVLGQLRWHHVVLAVFSGEEDVVGGIGNEVLVSSQMTLPSKTRPETL
jgi:hypothetical protein